MILKVLKVLKMRRCIDVGRFFFQAMLEDEHPDWLDPVTRFPLSSMEPLEEYEEDCETAPEEIQKEIDENRRAWANCKDGAVY